MAREGLMVARDLLVSVHGIGKHGAEELLAEIGPDMSVFPTPQALACWAGVVPRLARVSREEAPRQGAGWQPVSQTNPGDRSQVSLTNEKLVPVRPI